MSEGAILRQGMIALSRIGVRVFRAQVGLAWFGKLVHRTTETVVLERAAQVRVGIKGMSDLIGWHSITITPAMVGKRVAVFVAPEAKDKHGRLRPEQEEFLDRVREAGGIAFVFRSDEEAVQAIQAWTP